jgi:hypothetical protein
MEAEGSEQKSLEHYLEETPGAAPGDKFDRWDFGKMARRIRKKEPERMEQLIRDWVQRPETDSSMVVNAAASMIQDLHDNVIERTFMVAIERGLQFDMDDCMNMVLHSIDFTFGDPVMVDLKAAEVVVEVSDIVDDIITANPQAYEIQMGYMDDAEPRMVKKKMEETLNTIIKLEWSSGLTKLWRLMEDDPFDGVDELRHDLGNLFLGYIADIPWKLQLHQPLQTMAGIMQIIQNPYFRHCMRHGVGEIFDFMKVQGQRHAFTLEQTHAMLLTMDEFMAHDINVPEAMDVVHAMILSVIEEMSSLDGPDPIRELMALESMQVLKPLAGKLLGDDVGDSVHEHGQLELDARTMHIRQQLTTLYPTIPEPKDWDALQFRLGGLGK